MSLTRAHAPFDDHELLDSGDRMKCERFGDVVLVRPEPQALWAPSAKDSWNDADAWFTQDGEDGAWRVRREPPENWTVRWEELRFGLRLFTFKHTGLFPEQAANWKYIRERLRPGMTALNLFGYTGGATLAAAVSGAEVVHVDASRSALAVAKRNAELSGLRDKPIRWIEDDAMKFTVREVRRDRKYDLIVMDPPAFGRGPKKELWKFETDLRPLIAECGKLLRPGGSLLVNAYSLGFPAIVVEQVVRDVFPQTKDIETVELTLRERTPRAFLLPAGITVRATV